jgi:hypothetical protein
VESNLSDSSEIRFSNANVHHKRDFFVE